MTPRLERGATYAAILATAYLVGRILSGVCG